ncbi:MAG: sigma-54-dependent Fis family transcriptional regulator, partial [Candidatus Wallbacteria bacterium]|nr:sigma-54-dependent Fis family transcriptional regulator [Candidatus Wallbacteria bacterium]
REDLFYRLCQVPLTLPPIRERREDIAKLVQHFLELAQSKAPGRKGARFAPEVVEVLKNAEWRGNVRELKNVVERALALSAGPVVQVADLLLPDKPHAVAPVAANPLDSSAMLANRSLEDVEREAILTTLKANGGNRKKTARILGIAPVTLREKLRRYGLDSAAAAGDDD